MVGKGELDMKCENDGLSGGGKGWWEIYRACADGCVQFPTMPQYLSYFLQL